MSEKDNNEVLYNHDTNPHSTTQCFCRISSHVNIPALRTVQGQRSFGYTGSKDFNSLTLNLKSIKEYKYLKRETKKEHFSTCVMNIKCHILSK